MSKMFCQEGCKKGERRLPRLMGEVEGTKCVYVCV